MKFVFFFFISLSSMSAFSVALQVCHLDSAVKNSDRGFEFFCNSPDVLDIFRDAGIDLQKNTLNTLNAMIQGFNSIYDPASARYARQKYFISGSNRGKAIQLMRAQGFDSNNNVEFTRNVQLEVALAGQEGVPDNSERGVHSKIVDLRRNNDLSSAREARKARVRPQ
jgi:hypothetical protein